MKNKITIPAKLYTVLIFIILYAPIAVLIFFSFNSSNSTSVFNEFSLRWYTELFNDTATIKALKNTLLLAVISSIISTVLGLITATGLHYSKTKWYKKSIMTANNIPMVNPDIVTGISMMLLFIFVGTILRQSGVLGFGTMLIAHITFELPYVILNILPRFKSMDKNLVEAAKDLGCTPVQAFFKVTLPYLSAEIFAAFVMAFTLSIDDFVISYFVSGPEFQTLPIRIYSMTKKRVTPDIYALSTLIFVTVFVLLVLSNYSQNKQKRRESMNENSIKNNMKNNIKNNMKNNMKDNIRIFTKISAFLSIVLLIFSLSIPVSASSVDDYPINIEYYKNSPYRGSTLNVYNWGEYISDGAEGSLNVNVYFEELTGIKVNYTNYDSNEDMYAKIKSGGANYDLIIPSDYMIARMIDENLLLKLDYANIPNFKYISNEYKSLYFDPKDEYSVTYTVGYVALIYNTKLVHEAPTSWTALWDKRYAGNILMFNNPRDAFAIAQLILGQDLNSTNPDDWQRAYDKLLEQKPVVRAYVMDEIYNIMESGAAALAPYYVGDFLTMQENNEDLAVAFPKEGANIFVDSMCIPKTAKNKGAAELYINYMCEPEISLANAEYICYATPNTAVLEMDKYSFKGDEILYPDASVTEDYQYFHNLPAETQALMSNLWGDLKVDGQSNISTYIGLAVFAIVMIMYAIYAFLKKKHREKFYD
ncbi:MAG: extracellular solute-binding protein [Ruminococcaceae bacterium]|nr:extracellular solute-binding protein [Oscillospiraceae bacterium]